MHPLLEAAALPAGPQSRQAVLRRRDKARERRPAARLAVADPVASA